MLPRADAARRVEERFVDACLRAMLSVAWGVIGEAGENQGTSILSCVDIPDFFSQENRTDNLTSLNSESILSKCPVRSLLAGCCRGAAVPPSAARTAMGRMLPRRSLFRALRKALVHHVFDWGSATADTTMRRMHTVQSSFSRRKSSKTDRNAL